MITLIIFFIFIMILLLILCLYRVPISFKLKIKNDDLDFEYKAFFKERHIKNKITAFVKSGSAKFDKKILLDVSEVIDIENFETILILNTPFIHLTNAGVLFFSYFIPTLYKTHFRTKKGLYFKVTPAYNEWAIYLSVKGKIKVSLISIILIILKMKKRIKNVKESNV